MASRKKAMVLMPRLLVHKRSYATAKAPSHSHPLLIIFDLNGTLLDRRMKRYRPLAGNNENTPEPDFKLNSKYFYYLRPHLQHLFDYCFKYYQVGIWTSALPSNAYMSVVRVLGSSLSFHSTILDFEGPGGLTEEKCRASVKSGPVELDWLSPASFVSEQETRIRLDALAQLKSLKESASQSATCSNMTFPLTLLWTRRRCLLRNTCALDKTNNPFKPAAMKDVSQLWKRTKAAKTDSPNPLSIYSRYVIGENHAAIELPDDPSSHLSALVPEPFYRPPIPYYGHDGKELLPADAHLEKILKFKPSHTLIVDDSEYKFALTRRNGLVLPEYDISKDPERKDTTLLKLAQYLENYRKLGKRKDIRDYMEQFPFHQFGQQAVS